MSKYEKSKKGRFKMINLNSEISRRIKTEFILGSVIITWKKRKKNIIATQKSGINS